MAVDNPTYGESEQEVYGGSPEFDSVREATKAWLEARTVELDLSSCPYYQGTGTCVNGCYSEPSCITDEPLEGWPSRRTQPKSEDFRE